MSSSRPSRSNSAAGSGNPNPNPVSGQPKVTSFFARAKSQPAPSAAAGAAAAAKSAKANTHTASSPASRKTPTQPAQQHQDSDHDDTIDFSQEFDDSDASSAHLPTGDDDPVDGRQVQASDFLASRLPTPAASSSPPNADTSDLAPHRPAPLKTSSSAKPSSTTKTVPFFKTPAPIVRRSRFSPPPPPQKPKPSKSLAFDDEPALPHRPASPLGSAAAAAHLDAHLPSSADQTMALLFGSTSASSSSSKRASSLRRRRESDDANDQVDDDEDEGDGSLARRRPKMRRKDILSAAQPAREEVVDESMQWALTFVSSYLSTPDDRATARSSLRTFDLDFKFGPTVGIPRLTRWIRARDRGLEPDPHVGDVLRAIDMVGDMPAAKVARMLGMDVQEVDEVKEMAQNVFAEYGTLV